MVPGFLVMLPEVPLELVEPQQLLEGLVIAGHSLHVLEDCHLLPGSVVGYGLLDEPSKHYGI